MRELDRAWIQAPITQASISRLEERIQVLETLESTWNQTLANIEAFNVQWWEAKLWELRNTRDVADWASADDIAELSDTVSSIWNIQEKIDWESSVLTADEARRSTLANDIAVKEHQNIRAQEWIDYYRWLGSQVVRIFS